MPLLGNDSTTTSARWVQVLDDLKVIYHLIKPSRGASHQERLEHFYQGQAQSYDRFRQRLLYGREELYQHMARFGARLDSPIWLDLGGGTGNNLATVSDELAHFHKIYIVDLCPALLAISQHRIEQYKWSNVETVLADVTTFKPVEETVDLITFSYALTMIPDWFSALEQAYRLLRPGGRLGVVDFYVSRKYPPEGWKRHGWLTRHGATTWFASDNVFLSPDHLPYLHSRFHAIDIQENRSPLPFLPGVTVPYYRFIGEKQLREPVGEY